MRCNYTTSRRLVGRYEAGVLEEAETFFSCAFMTAWAPPIAAFKKLLELGFEVEAIYMSDEEEDCCGPIGFGQYSFAGTFESGEHRHHERIPPEYFRAFGYIQTPGGQYVRDKGLIGKRTALLTDWELEELAMAELDDLPDGDE